MQCKHNEAYCLEMPSSICCLTNGTLFISLVDSSCQFLSEAVICSVLAEDVLKPTLHFINLAFRISCQKTGLLRCSFQRACSSCIRSQSRQCLQACQPFYLSLSLQLCHACSQQPCFEVSFCSCTAAFEPCFARCSGAQARVRGSAIFLDVAVTENVSTAGHK